MNKISNKKDFEAAESILRQFAEKYNLERDKIQIIENYISPYKNKAENAKKLLQMVKTLHNNNF
jgi:ribosomal protein L20A (L18A)